jgi:hypothetical protein
MPNTKYTSAFFFLLLTSVTKARLKNDNVITINRAVVIKNARDTSVISTKPNIYTSFIDSIHTMVTNFISIIK